MDWVARQFSTRVIVLIPIAIAINIVLGYTVQTVLKLPIYLDSIGTILVGVLAGPLAGAATGALSNLIWQYAPGIGGGTIGPFAITAAVIGLLAGIWGQLGIYRSRPATGSQLVLFAIVGAAIVVLLAVFPLFAGAYPVKLLQEILIWGIFAMSLDLLMGYAGMVSFGHSAFFGIGGYVAALALTKSPGLISALVLPALAAGLAALVIGFFSIRVSGVYFIMLTLAFSQMFHAYTFQVSWLGAEDGLVGIPRPVVPGWDVSSLRGFHGYLLTLVTLSVLVLWRIVRSPFGHVLRGIHENEARMEAVGYAVDRYKLVAFVIAGVFAGLAGSLYAQFNGSITPDAFFWKTSGEALLMVIIGGTGTLGGAVLGAAAFILLQSLVSTYTERWMLILGVTFILLVLFAPGGIVGALRGRIGLRA